MRVVHCKKSPYTQYIGRPSPFGNPYSHKDDTAAQFTVDTVDEAIVSFEDYARDNASLLQQIKNLPEDAVLGCWCKPGPCHGDVIVKLWKELNRVGK